MSAGWDSATLKKLKALVGRGISTAEIGRKLGMSKNAVVGKLNRLGWNAKASESTKNKPVAKVASSKTVAKKTSVKKVEKTPTGKSKTTPKKKTVSAPKKPVAIVAKDKIVETKTASRKTNKDLALHQRIIQHSLEMANLKPNQCRWPIGDPDSEHFHFCGAQVFSGKPYCYEHCRQAYQFTSPKKK